LDVQRRAGVQEMARRVAASIHEKVPLVAKAFLESQNLVVLGTTHAENRPWASLLSGPPGFARTVDDQTIRI
jgi:predicted pyridoxine 5'-phosphate oxidase superfamily flavin-nucleotide-binding protein